VPKQDQAKIGQVVGELASNGDKWDVGLLFNQSGTPRTPPTAPVEALLGTLRLIYPNPDRHTGSDHRTPTPEEARVVVQLAIAIVHWAAGGPDLEEVMALGRQLSFCFLSSSVTCSR
jgi:hypothetical protein